jgi:23S rRNA (guanosine2251-2'-O)-methyltransferase
MAQSHLLYGRNVLTEALQVKAKITEAFYVNDNGRIFLEESLRHVQGRPLIQKGLPRQLKTDAHQGVAFKVEHDFYVDDSELDFKKLPLILMCNHLEDVQNLGSLARAAAGFGVGLIVHEDRRSAELTAAAIKVSAGQAFKLKFLSVSNLQPFCQTLHRQNYEIAAFSMDKDAFPLFDWTPRLPVAFLLGSENKGISKPLFKAVDSHIRIPMAKSVESLNVAQAGTVAMSWAYHHLLKK